VFVVARSPAARTRLVAQCRTAGLEVVGEDARWSDAPAAEVEVIVALDEGGNSIQAGGDEQAPPALLMLSDEPAGMARAARSGADGWAVLPTTSSSADIAAAAAAAVRGFAVAPAAWMPELQPGAQVDGDEEIPQERLTTREHEVLELVAEGRSNRRIASALEISEHTVKFHLASIYGKLGARTRTEAVRLGLRRGLITI
jgi:DNA-binding NarL/FixJ family response regulator